MPTDGLRLIVCGGRDYSDAKTVYAALDFLQETRGVQEIISGAARGADTLAARWAKDRGVKLTEIAADWDKHGRAAGPIRNQGMLNLKPNGVVAFPGGRGTDDMKSRSLKAGIEVWEPIRE